MWQFAADFWGGIQMFFLLAIFLAWAIVHACEAGRYGQDLALCIFLLRLCSCATNEKIQLLLRCFGGPFASPRLQCRIALHMEGRLFTDFFAHGLGPVKTFRSSPGECVGLAFFFFTL